MKRYTIDNPMDLSIESDDGEFVFYDEAQAEIDALKAQNAELMAALESIVAKNAIYHRLNDNYEWTLSKHQHDGIQEAIDLIAKINGNQANRQSAGWVMIRSCFELELGHDVPMDYDPECDDAVEM